MPVPSLLVGNVGNPYILRTSLAPVCNIRFLPSSSFFSDSFLCFLCVMNPPRESSIERERRFRAHRVDSRVNKGFDGVQVLASSVGGDDG